MPVLSMYSEKNVITKEIEIYKENNDNPVGIDLYLNLKSWPSVMSSASFRWALYKNGIYLSSGDFSGKKQGNNIKLNSNVQSINTVENKDMYTLYMWIDAYQESNVNMMNQSFTVSLFGETTLYDADENPIVNETIPNHPELADGMIPIKYNYLIDEWLKADTTNTDNDWYNYYNKIWANAVTVTTESRLEYMNTDVGTIVNEDDILAYYVWIPRYKYLLFNTEFAKISAREIQIEFQNDTDEIFEGTENGQFLTHPAFWWDNNGDGVRDAGEELAGIWVAKFETTGTRNNPTIKPNVRALTNIHFDDCRETLKKLNSINYLTDMGSSQSDSHMMKNMEWGAVAYLSHSKYGKRDKVTVADNYDTYLTGKKGNYTYNDFYIKEGKITSSKVTGSAIVISTTGNVYGIYGMSSGVTDIVAAGTNTNYITDIKYYDFYTNAPYSDSYSNSKLGDAIGETCACYGEAATNITAYGTGQKTFYGRGGGANANYAGIFCFEPSNFGGVYNTEGSRAVLILQQRSN